MRIIVKLKQDLFEIVSNAALIEGLRYIIQTLGFDFPEALVDVTLKTMKLTIGSVRQLSK